MSYNVSGVETLVCEATIAAGDVIRLRDWCGYLPEDCFLHDIKREAASLGGGDSRIAIKEFAWTGECSGNSWDFLRDTVAQCIRGRIEAIVTWEGGDSVSGLRIVDGVMTEPRVIRTLEP